MKSRVFSRRLLHVRNANCRYREAEETWKTASLWIERLELSAGHPVNKATLYSEISSLLFAKSLYDEVRQARFWPRG